MLTPYSAIIEKLRKWYPRANALSIGFGKNSVVIANSWYRENTSKVINKIFLYKYKSNISLVIKI